MKTTQNADILDAADQCPDKPSSSQEPALKPSWVPISEQEVRALHDYRKDFGQELFFKLFRAYYKLCVIPEDAQNNPFGIYMDRQSAIRGFEEIFGIKEEEIAVRFCKLF